jgi:hypothetical protein
MTVREVTGVFASQTVASPAVNDLLIAGFDRAEIDVLADGQQPQRVSQTAVPAVELADVPDAPRREFVTPGSQGGADLYEADVLRDANQEWLRDIDHAVQCPDGNCDFTSLSSPAASAQRRSD